MPSIIITMAHHTPIPGRLIIIPDTRQALRPTRIITIIPDTATPITIPPTITREKQLLIVDLVAGNFGLTRWRGEPVDERHTHLCLYLRIPCRVHQHDSVLVEESRVIFDDDLQFAMIVKVKPGASVGQHIAVAQCRAGKRLFHAPAGPHIPEVASGYRETAGRGP